MWKLQAQGIACAAIDLRQIGSPDITPDQWYAGIMRRLSTSFKTDAEYPEYNPKQGDTAPAHFDISFDESDQNYMQIFNNQAGVILQNAELLAEVKRHEISFKDSLSS